MDQGGRTVVFHEIVWSPGSLYFVSLHPQGIGFTLRVNVDHIAPREVERGSGDTPLPFRDVTQVWCSTLLLAPWARALSHDHI